MPENGLLAPPSMFVPIVFVAIVLAAVLTFALQLSESHTSQESSFSSKVVFLLFSITEPHMSDSGTASIQPSKTPNLPLPEIMN